jgi:L-amino acid N-acyltransferase YncA
MRYEKETFDSVINDIKPLLEDHYEEIALHKDKIPFSPNYFMYKELEDKGILDIFTARKDDELVGYCILFTMPHLHYYTTVFSNVDIFYIKPEYRGKMVGIRLNKFVESQLKKKGVKVINHHIKYEHDFSQMLYRDNYEDAEKIVSKYIGD